jgi:hypothetical protein
MKSNNTVTIQSKDDMTLPLYRYLFLLLLFLLFSTVFNQSCIANENLGKTILARGNVTADRADKKASLKRSSPVFRQDILRAGANARAQFRMIDNALINLQQNSALHLRKYNLQSGKENSGVLMELISGGLRTITGTIGKQNKKDYQLRTPIATIGIRGTMYEIEIMPKGGMYVGTWQGAISVRSHSGKCNIELGDGFNDRFVFVDPQGKCHVLKQIPKVFRDGHSSKTNSNNTQQPYEIEPLLEHPNQEQPFQTLTVGQQKVAITNGRTNTISRSTPVISTNNDGVVRSNTASVSDFSQNIGGYPVGWGRWNTYSTSPSLNALATPATDSNGLLWSTYNATNTDVVARRTGTVGYNNMIDSLAQSTMGKVTNLSVNMEVDFNSGQISKGTLSAQVPEHTWIGVFDGQVTNGKLSLGLNGAALVHSATGINANANGNISGDFIGENAKAITGGFTMTDAADDKNQIEGLFLIEQQ